jgi:hypothetical protein
MTEVIAFEQQWLAKPLGQGVGKAITEIQCGTMPTLAKLCESQTSQFSLTAINTDDLNLGCSQKAIEIGLSIGAIASSDHNGELH